MCTVDFVGSSSAVTPCALSTPLSTFNTGSNNAIALSTASSVGQPFHSASAWDVTGGFKFGVLTSEPLSSTVSLSGQRLTESGSASATDVAVKSMSSWQPAVLSSSQLSSSVEPATAGLRSQHSSVLAMSNSTHHDADAAQQRVMSPAADTGDHQVHDVSDSDVPNCCTATMPSVDCVTFSLVPSAAECDKSNSLVVTSSSAVMSRSAAAAAATSSVFSLPLTAAFSQQPTSGLFVQAAFAKNSTRPLGVPATSALQFSAAGCCFVVVVVFEIGEAAQFIFMPYLAARQCPSAAFIRPFVHPDIF